MPLWKLIQSERRPAPSRLPAISGFTKETRLYYWMTNTEYLAGMWKGSLLRNLPRIFDDKKFTLALTLPYRAPT